MRELLDDLEPLRAISSERLESDRLTRHAVERILGQLVDLAVAINGHIGAAVVGRASPDYRASFSLAVEAGAITDELATALSPSVGLRNILAHEYVGIDVAIVARSVGPALDGYRDFLRQVAQFIRSTAEH